MGLSTNVFASHELETTTQQWWKRVWLFFVRFDSPLLGEGALAVAVQGETLSSDFMTLCVWLVENLKNLCSVQESVSGK